MKRIAIKIILSTMAVIASVGMLPMIVASAEDQAVSTEIVESIESIVNTEIVEGEESVKTDQESEGLEESSVSSTIGEVLQESENTSEYEVLESIVEENEEEILATETSDWFDEVLMPMIIEYGTEVFSFATVVFIMLRDLNKTKSGLGLAVGQLIQSNKDNKTMKVAVEDFKAEMQSKVSEMQSAFQEALNEIKASLTTQVQDIDETAHKILDIEKIAYLDSAALVSSGAAKRIADTVRYGRDAREDDEEDE